MATPPISRYSANPAAVLRAGNVDIACGITGEAADRYPLQDAVAGAWLAFATSGDPNHASLARWRPFSIAERPTMVFDNPCKLAACRTFAPDRPLGEYPVREERLAIERQPAYEADALFRR